MVEKCGIILGRQQFRDILPFYWGEDTRFHHKTGSLDRVRAW